LELEAGCRGEIPPGLARLRIDAHEDHDVEPELVVVADLAHALMPSASLRWQCGAVAAADARFGESAAEPLPECGGCVSSKLRARDSKHAVGAWTGPAVDDIQKAVETAVRSDDGARDRVADCDRWILGRGRLGNRVLEDGVPIRAAEFAVDRIGPRLTVVGGS